MSSAAGADAVADDAPEPVDRLAVGHDLDLDVAALDEGPLEPRAGPGDDVGLLQAARTTTIPAIRARTLRLLMPFDLLLM